MKSQVTKGPKPSLMGDVEVKEVVHDYDGGILIEPQRRSARHL